MKLLTDYDKPGLMWSLKQQASDRKDNSLIVGTIHMSTGCRLNNPLPKLPGSSSNLLAGTEGIFSSFSFFTINIDPYWFLYGTPAGGLMKIYTFWLN